MKSIVLIFPYFGTLPAQYKMWRASALYNPTVHFLVFTDADIQPEQNIEVVKTDFTSFARIIQEAFDCPIVLDRPYKLCDYKTIYGFALQRYIKDYDYWGFGDMDIVYGDIRHFLTDEVLSAHKMLLGWGHLAIYRNDEDTNTYFMASVPGYTDYKDVISTEKIMFFDEFDHKGCADKWRDCRREDCWLEWPFDNASKPKQSYHFKSLTHGWENVLFEHVSDKLYMIRYKDGAIHRMESLYAHFQHRPFMKDKVTDYSHFLVTPASIIDYPRHFTTLLIRFHSRSRNLTTYYFRWRDRILFKLHSMLN